MRQLGAMEAYGPTFPGWQAIRRKIWAELADRTLWIACGFNEVPRLKRAVSSDGRQRASRDKAVSSAPRPRTMRPDPVR
jgi:hypothetical protein